MVGDVFIDPYAESAALGAEKNEADIDSRIAANIRGWSMNRLSKVSLALLRLAIYEMVYDGKIPLGVSINEAVELAKKYGDKQDAPFVNGVLGTIAKSLGEKNA